jgi:GT2 family glycosyltransferase
VTSRSSPASSAPAPHEATGRGVDVAVDVTVIVLSWNTKELTLRAMAAIDAACAPLRARAICVDNASVDGSAAAVRDAFPAATVIENPRNLGFARGNNVALPHAAGRTVMFLNSDTEAAPGSIAHVVAYLDAHPGVGVASPPLIGTDGLAQRTAWGFPNAWAMLHQHTPLGWLGVGRRSSARQRDVGRGIPTGFVGPVDVVAGAALAIRRDLCERLKGFDPRYPFYFEDIDLCARVKALGFEVHLVADGPPIRHHGGASATLSKGATRLPLLVGALRFQQTRLSPPAYRAFAAAFKLGVVLRASSELLRAPIVALLRTLRGRPERARRTWEMAAARRRFLERDVLAFLRAAPSHDAPGSVRTTSSGSAPAWRNSR